MRTGTVGAGPQTIKIAGPAATSNRGSGRDAAAPRQRRQNVRMGAAVQGIAPHDHHAQQGQHRRAGTVQKAEPVGGAGRQRGGGARIGQPGREGYRLQHQAGDQRAATGGGLPANAQPAKYRPSRRLPNSSSCSSTASAIIDMKATAATVISAPPIAPLADSAATSA